MNHDEVIEDLSGIKRFPLDRFPACVVAEITRHPREWRTYGLQRVMYADGEVRIVNLSGGEPNPFLLR